MISKAQMLESFTYHVEKLEFHHTLAVPLAQPRAFDAAIAELSGLALDQF